MVMTGNKSKPVYSPLRADTGGRFHLLVGSGAGAEALRRVLGELEVATPAALQRTQLLFIHDSAAGSAARDSFGERSLAGVHSCADIPALLDRCRALLERSVMGTRLYIAGPESFIGRVMQIALSFDLNQDEVRAEAIGTLARRVHCVHCRVTTENVRTNIAVCCGCSRWLTVRDHYSRRLAAYMGVMADAEAPGELPPVHEVFS